MVDNPKRFENISTVLGRSLSKPTDLSEGCPPVTLLVNLLLICRKSLFHLTAYANFGRKLAYFLSQ